MPSLDETFDVVQRPKHYNVHPSGVECIEVTRHMNFNLGNAIKYIWRQHEKAGVQDLEKAIWYLQDEIQRLGGINGDCHAGHRRALTGSRVRSNMVSNRKVDS